MNERVKYNGDSYITIQTDNAPTSLLAGDNITIRNNYISVTTTDKVEQDNTKPITSAAVYAELGNIATLLGSI